MNDLRQQLREQGHSVPDKGKFTCPFCGKHTFDTTKDNRFGQCFHPECRQVINTRHTGPQQLFQKLYWDVMSRCHHELRQQIQKGNGYGTSAWQLLKNRKIDSTIIEQCPVIGAVPTNLDITAIMGDLRNQINTIECKPKVKQQALKDWDEAIHRLQKILSNTKGWVVFAYTDVHHNITQLRFRDTTRKAFQCIVLNTRCRGVFNPTLFKDTDRAKPLLLAEGEFNILRLHTIEAKAGWQLTPALALGSAAHADLATVRRFSEAPILFRDHDDAGKHLAENICEQFTATILHSPVPGEDLEDFINGHQAPQDALRAVAALLAQASPRYRPLASIANDINAIRKNDNDEKLKEFEIKQQVGQLLCHELGRRGRFYHTPMAAYYLELERHRLIPIHGESRELGLLLHQSGLNPKESIHDFVIAELERHAIEYGEATTIHQHTYYNDATDTFYLYNGDTCIYRITDADITQVVNGTDGILFTDLPRFSNFQRVPVDTHTDLLSTLILNEINFDEGLLTSDDYKFLLEIWLYALLFNSMMATKPIAAFIGGKGSGKTSTFRRLGVLLYGTAFQVSSMPEKEDAFDAIVTNSPFVVFDNVDGQTAWLNDRLAITATGGTIQKRVLYTTNSLVDYVIKAVVAITSRTPKFRRDDVAERLLIFPVLPLPKKRSEQELINIILRHRDEGMSQLLFRIQEIVGLLKATKDLPPIETELRMADYATFLVRLVHHEGEDMVAYAHNLFYRLHQLQSQFALEHDPLFALLEVIAAKYPGREWTASELLTQLSQMASDVRIKFNYKSANSMGQKLAQLSANINDMMTMTITRGDRNTNRYTFWPKTTSPHPSPAPSPYAETRF
jgi:hypothetical protein